MTRRHWWTWLFGGAMSVEDRTMLLVLVLLAVALATDKGMWLADTLGDPLFFSSTAFVCILVGGLAILNYYRRQR